MKFHHALPVLAALALLGAGCAAPPTRQAVQSDPLRRIVHAETGITLPLPAGLIAFNPVSIPEGMADGDAVYELGKPGDADGTFRSNGVHLNFRNANGKSIAVRRSAVMKELSSKPSGLIHDLQIVESDTRGFGRVRYVEEGLASYHRFMLWTPEYTMTLDGEHEEGGKLIDAMIEGMEIGQKQ